jgi:hypothetical protein
MERVDAFEKIRIELALYSHHERGDLGFAAELNAEIATPFWRK